MKLMKKVTIVMNLEPSGVPSMIDLIEDALMSNESIVDIKEYEIECREELSSKYDYEGLHP